MRLVLAIISFALAAVMVGYGIAQRTVLAEPDEVSLSATITGDAPVTVIDGSALNSFEGSQTVSVSGASRVFAAYGRTSDVLAWVGKAEYNLVRYNAKKDELSTKLVRGTETEVPDPEGSDLWLDDYARDKSLSITVSVPANISFIIVSDGTKPAPPDLSITWPVDNSTPWSGPLIIGGAVVLLIGLAFLLWSINHVRGPRGPRRTPQKMPKVPRKPGYKPSRKTIDRPSSGRRAIGRGMIAVPILLVGALALSGCSADALGGSTPDPTPSETAPASLVDPPAVTVRQVERIVARISATTATADAARDVDLIKTRFDGAALELRLASYAVSTADPSIAGLPAIPEGPVTLTLPQQTDTWPRTVLAVIQNDKDATVPPLALYLVQDDARSNYKVSYAITLEPSAEIPPVAPAAIGTAQLAPDSPVLRLSPTEVALAYADILEKDVDSVSYLDFQADGDSLRTAVASYKASIRTSLPATAGVTFGHAIGAADAIALATNNAGAIIAVHLYETTTVTPVEAGAAVNPSGQVKALSGVAISTKGVIATYGDQLMFYVPPAGGDGKIVLLGYSQGLVKASEVG